MLSNDILHYHFHQLMYLCFSNGGYGQIGTGGREEATVPRYIEEGLLPVRLITAGTNHNIVIDGRFCLIS